MLLEFSDACCEAETIGGLATDQLVGEVGGFDGPVRGDLVRSYLDLFR